jgi:hypothetical protein
MQILSSTAFADPGASCHFHGKKEAPKETLLKCAMERKEMLIGKGKIPSSWKDIKHDKIEQVDGRLAKEWLVTFRDTKAKDMSTAILYMFFSLNGNFIAANFTGK